MTTLSFTGASAPIHSDHLPFKGAPSLFRRCFDFLAREYRAHCGLRAMMALDDRMLSDIGLSRAEVEFAAHCGRARSN